MRCAARPGSSYSKFMHGLKAAGLDLNRKVLADIALHDEAAFRTLVAKAKGAAGEGMSPVEQESDSLSSLEQRIQQAVDLVVRLRKEKDAAVEEAALAKAEAARLSEELRSLQTERKQVRSRIEKLLGQIDQLSAG